MGTPDLIRKVADHLPNYEVDADSRLLHGLRLRGPDGRCLFLADSINRGARLSILGDYPEEAKQAQIIIGHPAPRITVSAVREPERIARDIERRLLPDYDTWFNEAQNMAQTVLRERGEAERAAEELAGIVGGRVQSDGRHAKLMLAHGPHGRVQAVLYAGDSVSKLELASIPVEKAKAILRLLAEE